MPKLVVLDAHAYLHRAFHALPPLSTSKGEPVGALFGFAKTLLKLIRELAPDRLAVCFDSPGPTFRKERFAEYKATRKETDQALKTQLGTARELVEAWGLKAVAAEGYEADDLIAALARRGAAQGMEVVIVTSDKDVLQLVDGPVKVLNERKGEILDAGKVESLYGVPPSLLTDYFALVGDSSDNVPGVKGIGPDKALKLLKDFKTLDGILAASAEGLPKPVARLLGMVREQRESALLSRELVTLDRKAPVPDPAALGLPAAPGPRLMEMLRRLEFSSLISDVFKDAPSLSGGPETELGSASAAPAAEITFKELAAGNPKSLAVSFDEEVLAVRVGDEAAFARPEELEGAQAKALKEMLGGPAAKTGHDLKRVMRVLAPKGIPLTAPFFDTMLAAWCLNPSRPRVSIEDTTLEYLGLSLPAGKGRGRLAAEAEAAGRLAAKLGAELEAKGLKSLFDALETPLVEVLAGMEAEGIAVDREYLGRLQGELGSRTAVLEAEMQAMAGAPINLNSPKQIAGLLFGKLNLPTRRKTKTGFSTDDEVLHALAPLHPFPAKLIEFRELSKLKSTYVDSLLEQSAAGGRVHTQFLQTGTVTGRISSVGPNLQNIPVRTPEGQKVRRAFTAPEGSTLLSADYSQIDLRVLAHLSGDKALGEAFATGQDIHTRTACEVFHLAPDKVDPESRRRAKAINFGIIYGQTPHGLARELGIAMTEAQDYIQRYFKRYPGVQAWIQAELATARKDGAVRTMLGRVRWLPDIASKNPNVRGFAERVAVNTPIQGTAADIIKKAMLSIWAGLKGRRTKMLLQVHDELIFEVPKEELEEVAPWVRKEMEGAVALKVPVEAGLKAGPNWQDMEKLKA